MKGSTALMINELIILANNDPSINTQLSYLVHDRDEANPIIPSIDVFRSDNFLRVPTLSAKQVEGAAGLNVFSFGTMYVYLHFV